MGTPPLTSPSSESTARHSHSTSSGPTTPTVWRNTVRFLHCAFDSDEEDDGDIGTCGGLESNAGSSRWHARLPLTPTKTGNGVKTSPSRFLVKGTVTPSRAAPLFARFSKDRRAAQRIGQSEWSDSDDEEEENRVDVHASVLLTPTKRSPLASKYAKRPLLEPSHRIESHSGRQHGDKFVSFASSSSERRHSHFITPSLRASQPPLMPISIPTLQRPCMATSNVASYMLAMRSNNVGHLSYATSARGSMALAAGRGVLGAARLLGGGGPGLASNLSHRSFHQTFQTSSNPSNDLFTLPSEQVDRQFSHPLSAEYANSSRCLSGQKAQWLAVGSNEGRVYLLNTREGGIPHGDGSTPSWLAHDGSIFEVKWRADDEVIATGGSDYRIRIWNTATGDEVRSFSGHRGTPRSIAWDSESNGNILASGGRDGAIHVYDIRTRAASSGSDGDPVISLWGAHTYEPPRPLRGPGSRGGRRGAHGRASYPKGVTSLTYVPGRGRNTLCSAGCGDGVLKLWDLRSVASNQQLDRESLTGTPDIRPFEQGPDVSMQFRQNKSPHGISSIVASSTKIFAACTDGCIYTLPAADLLTPNTTGIGLPAVPLFDAAQRGNTLYARLALHDDERTLALGCNSGTITVWDTHAATLASAELASLGVNMASACSSTGLPSLPSYGDGHEDLMEKAKPAILRGGHRSNYEINGISWSHGMQGPTLASISDDYTIRTWYATNSAAEEGY